MTMNGFRPKSNQEFSEYQKRIEAIDTVILCVAEAEKMFRDVGTSLISESEIAEKLEEKQANGPNSSRANGKSFYT